MLGMLAGVLPSGLLVSGVEVAGYLALAPALEWMGLYIQNAGAALALLGILTMGGISATVLAPKYWKRKGR